MFLLLLCSKNAHATDLKVRILCKHITFIWSNDENVTRFSPFTFVGLVNQARVWCLCMSHLSLSHFPLALQLTQSLCLCIIIYFEQMRLSILISKSGEQDTDRMEIFTKRWRKLLVKFKTDYTYVYTLVES